MYKKIENYLQKQNQRNLLRTLFTINSKEKDKIHINNKILTDFSSNDYLSISDHPYLKKKSKEFTEKYGTGGQASRLLSGNFEYHVLLEEHIAKLKNKEAGLILGSGYITNTSVIPALISREDAIFADKFVHASIIDGIILSRAKFFRFHHNDMNHLEGLLRRERKNYKSMLIITESVFSMDGDKAPLSDIIKLKEEHNGLLYVDEAHATGIFGKTGAGLVEHLGLSEKCDIIMGTFSKALGSYGAYIATSKLIKKYLINKARGFIFSTALPASIVGASIAGIELLKKEPYRRKKLLEKSNYLRNKLLKAGLNVIGDSQIIPVVIGDAEKTIKAAKRLRENGFYILPIRPPTVPDNSSRLRLSLMYDHSIKILDKLAQLIKDNLKK